MSIRTQMVDSAGTTTWGYDALYRLTSAGYPNGDVISYGYDVVGNRTSLTVNGSTTTNTFDNADRMTASGSDTYAYNNNGNLTSKTVGGVTTSYAYDALNRLTSISSGGSTVGSYVYNRDGLRVSKTVGGTTTNFIWDATGLGTALGDGTAEYVWGTGLISRDAGTSALYAHQDGLGSTRLVTDNTGAVAGTTQYDALGAARSTTGTKLRFGFTGEQVDAESGLVYLRARYMDPATGRFLTKDPIGFAGGSINLYAYVRNSPLNLIDPEGTRDTSVQHRTVEEYFLYFWDMASQGWEREWWSPDCKQRLDLYNPNTNTFYEIEPHNARGMKEGPAQIARYQGCGYEVEASPFPESWIEVRPGYIIHAWQANIPGLVFYEVLESHRSRPSQSRLPHLDPGIVTTTALIVGLGLIAGLLLGGGETRSLRRSRERRDLSEASARQPSLKKWLQPVMQRPLDFDRFESRGGEMSSTDCGCSLTGYGYGASMRHR